MTNGDVPESRTEKGNTAKNFLGLLKNRSVWLMLHFMLDVTSTLAKVSGVFENQTATVYMITEQIEVASRVLQKYKQTYVN